MKKRISALLIGILVAACAAPSDSQRDALRFKEEYESLNGQENTSGIDYVDISIPEENPIIYADIDKLMEIIDSEGIIYFGFDECPWCRNALPVLIEAVQEKEVEEIYYYDIKEIRDELKLNEDGVIEVIKEKSEDYQKIYDALYESLNVYEGLNDVTIKRLYAPSVFFIKNGEVVLMHESTVESQADPSVMMGDAQKQKLKDIYIQGLEKISNTYCDTNC